MCAQKFVFRFFNLFYFLRFYPPKSDFEGFFFFCVEKAFLVFWVFVLFHPIFFAFPPLKRFRGTSPSFVLEKAFLSMLGVCVLVCLSTSIFPVISPALNPVTRFRLDFFFFCARESILVYFWCLRCCILFSSLFSP